MHKAFFYQKNQVNQSLRTGVEWARQEFEKAHNRCGSVTIHVRNVSEDLTDETRYEAIVGPCLAAVARMLGARVSVQDNGTLTIGWDGKLFAPIPLATVPAAPFWDLGNNEPLLKLYESCRTRGSFESLYDGDLFWSQFLTAFSEVLEEKSAIAGFPTRLDVETDDELQRLIEKVRCGLCAQLECCESLILSESSQIDVEMYESVFLPSLSILMKSLGIHMSSASKKIQLAWGEEGVRREFLTRLYQQYKNQECCDFTLVGMDNEEIDASPLLLQRIKTLSNSNEIYCTDFSIETLKHVVEFIYLGEEGLQPKDIIANGVEQLGEILRFAELYSMPDLLIHCINLISLVAKRENLSWIEELLTTYSDIEQLKNLRTYWLGSKEFIWNTPLAKLSMTMEQL